MADIFDSRVIPTGQLISKDGWHNESTPALSEQNLDNNQEALWHLIENNNKFFMSSSGQSIYDNLVNDDNNIWTWYNTAKNTTFIASINGVAVTSSNVTINKNTVGLGNVENVSHENLTVGYANKLLSVIGNADFDNTSTLLNQGNSYTPVYFNDGIATNCTINNSNAATSLSTSERLVTERAIYYGLPTINGVHNYNSGTSIYAPITAGTTGQVLRSQGSSNPIWDSPTDNNSATALNLSSNKLVTERAVYFGLPTINDSHTYTNTTKIYAVTSKGTDGQVLVSQGTEELKWANPSTLSVGSAVKATQDANGNTISSYYAKKSDTITDITFNNDGTVSITKNGTVTTQNVTAVSAMGPIVTAVVQSTAPTNTSLLWIDSANGYILKVYNSNIGWIAPRSVWGG